MCLSHLGRVFNCRLAGSIGPRRLQHLKHPRECERSIPRWVKWRGEFDNTPHAWVRLGSSSWSTHAHQADIQCHFLRRKLHLTDGFVNGQPADLAGNLVQLPRTVLDLPPPSVDLSVVGSSSVSLGICRWTSDKLWEPFPAHASVAAGGGSDVPRSAATTGRNRVFRLSCFAWQWRLS